MNNKSSIYIEKIEFSVSCMLLFTIHVPDLRLSRQKFFCNNFVSVWSCSACLKGIILGENAVMHLENELK